MPSPKDLLHRLFEYIGEQLNDTNPRGYRLSSHTGFMRRRGDLAGLPGVEFDVQVEGDHVWLRIQRLEATPPPVVPERHRGLIRVGNDPEGPPPSLDEAHLHHWLSTAAKGKTSEERKDLEARGRLAANRAVTEYAVLWNAWAVGEKPRRKTIGLYGDLFALKHALESEETAKPIEIVWGVGITTWQLEFKGANVDFEYPLLTQTMEVALDEKSLALEVRPRATNTRVELDAFVACSVTGAADAERAVRQHIERNKERPVTPFDASSYTDVLKLIAGNLDSEGRYLAVLAKDDPIPAAGEHIVVTDAWVMLSRPRANNVLVDDLRRLQEKLAAGCELPEGVSALVSPPSDEPVNYEAVNFRGLSSRGETSGGRTPVELYFPLPYNEEQVTIVSRLDRAAGVTVQGPPGTGKTHTIANIICHYLATGRRVLVTSKGEPALEVLQQKIPKEVQPLTVALLTGDREGIRQFQASIEAIQHQVSQLNPALCQQEIETLKQAIDCAHAELAKIDRRVDEIALAQLADVEIDGVPMRAQKLAEMVVDGREKYGWFDDEVTFTNAPPLTEAEGRALREARRSLRADLVYTRAQVPSADDFPRAAAIAELHAVMCRIREFEAQERDGELPSLTAMTREVLDAAQGLLNDVEHACALAEELDGVAGGWPMELRFKCRLPTFAAERKALESLFEDLDDLVSARAELLRQPIEMSEACLASAKARQAIGRGAESGRPFGLVTFGAGEIKELLGTVRVSGLAPRTQEDWTLAQRYVTLHERVLSFSVRWNGFAETLKLPKLEGGVANLRHFELTATAARKAHELAMTFDPRLPVEARKVFAQPPVKDLLGGSQQLDRVRQQLVRHLSRAELSAAATQFSALQEKLGGKSGPVSDELRQFLGGVLGNRKFAPEHVAARFAELMAELRRIASLGPTLAVLRDASKRLANAGAPKLASRVQSVPVEAAGEDIAFPVIWRDAWTWARIRSHLDTIEARDELVAMSGRRASLESGLAKLYRDMVGKAAWLSAKRNSTPKVLQALAGYATAIRRIGMGTGPNAVRFRRDAREAMLDAAGAVPCWIMSHFKVSESMPAHIGAFDLVIVDEASQSDLWALPAIVRGAKILVVGDDKQVSPDPGFIDSQRIVELKNRFLADQPYGMEMTPEKSLYELAARVFAAEQVMLREHFRCVSPIIAYSNRNFYKDAIAPLRIPRPSERIDPPLVDIYVPDGARTTRDCNQAEAEAIVAEIKAVLTDERLANRTLGVISLLGMEQAKQIDSLVRRECDAAALLHRKFECGDARTFQGSERDIMFLSLVVDRSSCKAVSGNMFEQRFNVAGSRARDRMYLVRSVEIADLSDKDLRQTLLAHFSKPMVVSSEEAEVLINRCESGFERDVFIELTKRGYRVMPQVKSGAYRLDMVVEGENDSRLAIECDGDEFHGPDRWAQDTLRQRVLERAGWTFWRCFASTWVLHKDELVAELLSRLTAMGIGPVGSADRAPAFVEKRAWKPESNGEANAASEALDAAIASSN
jgi:very-short-patch-repair endonuclease